MAIINFILVSLTMLFIATQPAHAVFGCVKKSEICVDSGTKNVPVTSCDPPGLCPASVAVTRDCWKYDSVYECYTGASTSSCSAEQLAGCHLASTDCKEYAGTTCTKWTSHYICSDNKSVSCGSDLPVDGSCTADPQTAECTKDYLGTCVEETTTYTCYAGAPEQCNLSDNCTLSGTECLSIDNGLCGQQRQVYTCSESQTACSKEQTVTRCTDGKVTYGLENQAPGPESQGLGKAMAGMSILEALNDGMNNSTDLTVFKGQANSCVKPIASGWLTNNCCKINVKDEGDHLFAQCTEEEIDLAAARRAKRTHYLGDYCSNKFLGVCLEKTQTYCVFGSLLSRIIQEQGRAQLAALSASGFAGSTSEQMDFDYYNVEADSAAWTPPVTVNGNKVQAFKWPGYCRTTELMAQAYNTAAATQDPDFVICPTVPEVYTASCGLSDCGALPLDPRSSSDLWEIQSLDPLDAKSASISKYVAATGSCNPDTEACSYRLTAWPAGDGGKAVIKMDISWPLYMPPGAAPSTQQVGNYMFRMYSETGFSGPVPETVKIDFSTDNAITWTNGVLIPTDIKAEDNYQLKASPEVNIYGACDTNTLQCNYRVVAQANVNTLPWGSAESPNCGGFTLAQLSVLDFGKMDLNEWMSSLNPQSTNQAALTQKAATGTQDFYDTYTSNSYAQADSPTMTTIAKASPSEGVGPFTTTLTVTGNWPMMYPDPAQNTNPVTSVTVDWGDGKPPTSLTKGASGAYVGTHLYDNQTSNVTHRVGITLNTTASGVRTSTFDIKNYADTPDPSAGSGGTATTGELYKPGTAPGGAAGINAAY